MFSAKASADVQAIDRMPNAPQAVLRRLEWHVRRAVNTSISGDYRSAFRGRGMEFDQVVKYQWGDDLRDIDWNVTARLGEAYRKKFVEERELAMIAGPGKLRVETPPLLLDDCSGLELHPSGAGMALLGRRVAQEAPEASVAMLVTGSEPSTADLRLGSRHVPTGTRTVVVRCERGADVSVRTHGTLSLATIGSLDDLPRLLRRVTA